MSLRSPVWRNGALDGAAWAEQPLIWSERQRGRALYWPGGEDWFVNDPLGRIPHSHPDASELYLVVAGRLELTVGRTRVDVGAGGYCFIPPDTFHDPHNPGPDDLCLFVIVAPNWRDRRWKTDGFVDADYASFPGLAETAAPGPLPGDESIRASVEELGAGEASEVAIRGNEDRTIYVLDGRARLEVGPLSGTLERDEYFYVIGGERHLVANDGPEPLRYLSVWTPDAAQRK